MTIGYTVNKNKQVLTKNSVAIAKIPEFYELLASHHTHFVDNQNSVLPSWALIDGLGRDVGLLINNGTIRVCASTDRHVRLFCGIPKGIFYFVNQVSVIGSSPFPVHIPLALVDGHGVRSIGDPAHWLSEAGDIRARDRKAFVADQQEAVGICLIAIQCQGLMHSTTLSVNAYLIGGGFNT